MKALLTVVARDLLEFLKEGVILSGLARDPSFAVAFRAHFMSADESPSLRREPAQSARPN
ncbi:MAG: hypothetical protein JWR52_2559 [Marmoricola sp.]|nr:hypothetical protein [Marmoricola sp.]